MCLFLVFPYSLDTLNTTTAACSNHTCLTACRSFAEASRWMTNVLVVTTTVGVLYGVHCHTSHLGPFVALYAVLVVASASLEHWLVSTTSTRNNTNLTTAPVVVEKCKLSIVRLVYITTYIELTVFFMPEGRRILVVPFSSLWVTMTA